MVMAVVRDDTVIYNYSVVGKVYQNYVEDTLEAQTQDSYVSLTGKQEPAKPLQRQKGCPSWVSKNDEELPRWTGLENVIQEKENGTFKGLLFIFPLVFYFGKITVTSDWVRAAETVNGSAPDQNKEARRLYIFKIDSHCEIEGNSKCLEHKLQYKAEWKLHL